MTDTYTALIVSVKEIRPIAGADRIGSATVAVNDVAVADVVTSRNVQVGTQGIYFCPDIQLSESYAAMNDLLARYDEQGNKIGGGFFDEKRKVRAQKFKSVKSEGLFMPLQSVAGYFNNDSDFLAWAGQIHDGQRFQTVNDQTICQRYPKPIRPTASNNNVIKKILEVLNFPEHYNTCQIVHYLGDLDKFTGGTVYISEKMHGTSHRVGKCQIRKSINLNIWQKINNKLSHFISWFKPVADHYYEYGTVHGSRRVVLNDANTGYYGSHDFRYDAVGDPNLNEEEVIYGEIVGWVNEKTPIMPEHSTKDLKDVRKHFGDTMLYDYGLYPGESKFFVYRITQMKDGIIQDLPYPEMISRATELGYSTPHVLSVIYNWNGNVSELMDIVKYYAEPNGYWNKSSYGSHIREGVVIVFEKDGRSVAFKYKGLAFKIMEGIMEVPDMEESDGGN